MRNEVTPAQNTFIARIERRLKGVQFFSVGTCPGCDECSTDENDSGEDSFSVSCCRSCGSTLGGARHPAHGVIADTPEEAQFGKRAADGHFYGKPGIEHFMVCTDCVMFHANGDLPEAS